MIKLLSEIVSFYKFYIKTKKTERRVVFYAEDNSSYSYFEGLINCLTNGRNQPIWYVTSSCSDPMLHQKRKNITALYIKSLLAFFILFLDSDLLIMTMPDLHRFHIRRPLKGVHNVYLFHNIGSSFPVIRFGALFYYDTIFCVGPHHIEEIRKQEEIYGLPKKNLVNFGYYRIEKGFDNYKNYLKHLPNDPHASRRYKAHILIGPSWGQNSILNFCGEELIRLLLQANYKVTVRPHPMTRKKDPGLLDRLNKKFKQFDNYIYEDNIASFDAVYRADLLISDWSGFSFEYAFSTERPVLFIDVPQKIVNPRYKEVGIEPIDIKMRYRIGAVLKTEKLEDADSVIADILKRKDSYVEAIRRTREEFVYNFGNSSGAGADFITGFLRDRLGDTVKNINV